jgi:hypothetical protein
MKKPDTKMTPAFEDIPKKKKAKKKKSKGKETMAEFAGRRNKETKGMM